MSRFSNPYEQLQAGLAQLSIQTDAQRFLDYLKLLHQWNQAYNLTAVREINEMIPRHIMDSLSIMPWLQGQRLLDVGSGGGFPGIPLAIARPDLHITVLDSHGKKTRFLQEVKRVLSLTNVDVIKSRVESYHVPVAFDTVMSRAFSQIDLMLDLTKHLLIKDGVWVAMKSMAVDDELSAISHPYHIETYQAPGTTYERCCVIIRNSHLN